MCDVEKLLFLIKQRAVIYNFKLKEHSDKRIVDKLWSEIAEEMQTTVTECKAKYTCLRNSYARFLREQPPSGSVANKKKKKWYLAAAMSFLKDHMMVHRTTGSRTSKAPAVDILDDSMPSIPSPSNQTTDCAESHPSFSGSRKRKLTAADKLAEPMAEYFKAKLSKNQDENPNLTFFKSLLPDMDKLSQQNQRKVKQDFLLNLNKILEEQEMEFPTIKAIHEI